MRKIIHIDMDAFFASVEQRDFPELRGKPVVVGSPKRRGVISAASYEAREFGVRSAMPGKLALQKCPHLIFMPHRFEAYTQVSRQVHAIFEQYTDLIEPLSLDEAYLDVTENKLNYPSATILARRIKQQIHNETGLTASAGISYNKFLAKVASDWRKPDGLFTITPDMAQDFIDQLPIGQFYGVGRKTAERMKQIGIHTGHDLRQRELLDLVRLFGKSGSFFYDIVRGIDHRSVQPMRGRKSVGAEHTFEHDLVEPSEISQAIDYLAETLWSRLDRKEYYGRTLTLKIKFADFEQITRSHTQAHALDSHDQIRHLAHQILVATPLPKAVRLLGLAVANLPDEHTEAIQLAFDFEF